MVYKHVSSTSIYLYMFIEYKGKNSMTDYLKEKIGLDICHTIKLF